MKEQRLRRRKRIRGRVSGTTERPRLSVFKSNKFIYAQVIDDVKAHTVAAAYGKSAAEVGEKLAERTIAKKVKTVVFDRGGYRYHGKVKILAEKAREKGLIF